MVIAVETSEHISWSSQNMISNQWFIMITVSDIKFDVYCNLII